MIFATLDYGSKNYKDMSDIQREAMLKFWPGLRCVVERRRASKPDDENYIHDLSTWDYGTTQRISLEEAHGLEIAGIKIDLSGVDGTMLTKMSHREDKYGTVTPMELTTGQVVQIAVPDVGILMMNEVDWIENACTQELQRRLDDGWRILAVCPPNAQRRPDYILGRHNQERK